MALGVNHGNETMDGLTGESSGRLANDEMTFASGVKAQEGIQIPNRQEKKTVGVAPDELRQIEKCAKGLTQPREVGAKTAWLYRRWGAVARTG